MSNFSARFLISTLGRLKEKNDWQDLTILISPVQNNFIKNLYEYNYDDDENRQFSVYLRHHVTTVSTKGHFGMVIAIDMFTEQGCKQYFNSSFAQLLA